MKYRELLSPAQAKTRSRLIVQRLSISFQRELLNPNLLIAYYEPIGMEVDIRAIGTQAKARLILPSKQGFSSTAPDIIFAPLVAFDRNLNRLGRGGGWYDRYLAESINKPLVIGIAYDFQQVPCVPIFDHDYRMDAIVTEGTILKPLLHNLPI